MRRTFRTGCFNKHDGHVDDCKMVVDAMPQVAKMDNSQTFPHASNTFHVRFSRTGSSWQGVGLGCFKKVDRNYFETDSGRYSYDAIATTPSDFDSVRAAPCLSEKNFWYLKDFAASPNYGTSLAHTGTHKELRGRRAHLLLRAYAACQ